MGCYQRPGGRRWAKRPGKSAFSQLSMLLRRAVRTWGNGRAEGGGRGVLVRRSGSNRLRWSGETSGRSIGSGFF